jgi:large exoprotein involved in heme utilization and adhesion
LLVSDGAVLASDTQGQGNAGELKVNARDSVQVIGTSADGEISSGLFTSVQPNATGNANDLTVNTKYLLVSDGAGLASDTQGQGNAGDLTIKTSQLTLQDRGQLVVSGQGDSNPGNLIVTADNITLDNQSAIEANTASGSQGNITLNTQDLITLRRNSTITTDATGTATGGNITINASDGFIVAVPEENSDITANAIQARGGQVEIDARELFGIEARNEQTPQSDITATSDLGVQFSGDININTPEIDPEAGLNELPTVPIDADALIAQNLCTLKDGRLAGGSSFLILGRGGLPPSADEPSTNKTRIVDWATSSPSELSSERLKPREREAQNEVSAEKSTTSPVIEQALGWAKTKDGKIVLTANAPVTVTPTGAISFPHCGK